MGVVMASVIAIAIVAAAAVVAKDAVSKVAATRRAVPRAVAPKGMGVTAIGTGIAHAVRAMRGGNAKRARCVLKMQPLPLQRLQRRR